MALDRRAFNLALDSSVIAILASLWGKSIAFCLICLALRTALGLVPYPREGHAVCQTSST